MPAPVNPGLHSKYLLYGPAGSGKTWTAFSALWDADERRELATGKVVTFGQEENLMIGLPEHFRQTIDGPGGKSLRLKSPELENLNWLTDLKLFAKARIKAAKEGNFLDFIILDGLSELDLLYEHACQLEKWDKWDGLLAEFFTIMQLFDPAILQCSIIGTARTMERKKGMVQDRGGKKVTVGEDPDFMEFDYYPAMRGSFRLWFPHYFHSVHYLHTRKPTHPGPADHIIEMSTGGDFLVKNQAEHLWFPKRKVVSGYPLQIVNGGFYDIYTRYCHLTRTETILPWKEGVNRVS